MVRALENADERNAFYIRTHIGNQSLFLSGVFPQRITSRAERRGFPDLSYFESLGKANFRIASDHKLAQRYNLARVFAALSEHFRATRLALNDIAERLFSIGEVGHMLDALLLAATRPPKT